MNCIVESQAQTVVTNTDVQETVCLR